MLILGLIGLAVVVGLWGIAVYNGLVTARNAYKNAFAQIDVQLNRRYDLTPNLVGGFVSDSQRLSRSLAMRGMTTIWRQWHHRFSSLR